MIDRQPTSIAPSHPRPSSSVRWLAAVTVPLLVLPVAGLAIFQGDCDGNGRVAIAEVQRCANIFSGHDPAGSGALSTCSPCDQNGDRAVSISELQGVANCFLGAAPPACRMVTPHSTSSQTPTASFVSQTPTRTRTLTPTATRSFTSTPSPAGSPTPTLPDPTPALLETAEFRIDSSAVGHSDPALCLTESGEFVVTWTSGSQVLTRKFDSNANAIGNQNPADAARPGSASSVTCDEDGRFVVVWEDQEVLTNRHILGRRFDANGGASGATFQVDTDANGNTGADVCGNGHGNFFVVWQENSTRAVVGRRYANGSPATEPFRISPSGDVAEQPSAACNSFGESFVAWHRLPPTAIDSIDGQRFAANGTVQGGVLTIGSSSTDIERSPDAALDEVGGYSVVWQEDTMIAGRVPNSTSGVRVAPPTASLSFGVIHPLLSRSSPAIAADATGTSVAVWREDDVTYCIGRFCSTNGDCIGSGQPEFQQCRSGLCCSPVRPLDTRIVARRFMPSGQPVDEVFRVDQVRDVSPTRAAVDLNSGGTFVVAWERGGEIWGRRYLNHRSPSVGALSRCGASVDQWTFDAVAGKSITVDVDTLEAHNAADLCVSVDCGGSPVEGDDEATCSHALPAYGCPKTTFISPVTGSCTVRVKVCSAVCQDLERASYRLIVHNDGRPLQSEYVATTIATPASPPLKPLRPYAGEQIAVPIAAFRSLSGKVYVVIPSLPGKRIRMTSMAIVNGAIVALAERWDGEPNDEDLVVTALAASRSGGLFGPDQVHRTAMLTNLPAQAPVFDACGNSGEGLLTFSDGRRVSWITPPGGEVMMPLTVAGGGVPRAARFPTLRKIDGSTVNAEMLVFPNPPAVCVGGTTPGAACLADAECPGTVINRGRCGQSSRGPSCGPPSHIPCDPGDVAPIECSGGACDDLGGEVTGQNITLDDRLDSSIGNSTSQPGGADGFLLDGTDTNAMQAVVFAVDGGTSAKDVRIAVAGFVLDERDRVIGTAAGGAAVPATLDCSLPVELRVDPDGAGNQYQPALCARAGVGSAVAWVNDGDVFAQIFAADGSAAGTSFLANTYTAGQQGAPAVACLPSGDLVVVWESENQDGDGFGIYGRRFDDDGTPRAGEFRANLVATGSQRDPDVDSLANGGFVVTWSLRSSFISVGPDRETDSGIFARRYDAQGQALDTQLEIIRGPNFTGVPSVCGTGDGGFAVSWTGYETGDFSLGVRGRVVDATGVSGASFGPSRAPLIADQYSDLVCRNDGGLLVTYESKHLLGSATQSPDGSGLTARASLFNASGAPLGAPFIVNTVTAGDQFATAVATTDDDGFLVVWSDAAVRISGRPYSSEGVAIGPQTRIDGARYSGHAETQLSCPGDDGCLAVWSADDGDEVKVFMQRLP